MELETIIEEADEQNEDIDDLYHYELPQLIDKSKYKQVAMMYCREMHWNQPQETVQRLVQQNRFRATVSFGKQNSEKSMTAKGMKKKKTIYDAYMKLIPLLIPQKDFLHFISSKFAAKRNKNDKSESIESQHPKSVILEWAQKYSVKAPFVKFSQCKNENNNSSVSWNAEVMFCGKKCVATATSKKDAEFQCFAELLKLGTDVNLICKHKKKTTDTSTRLLYNESLIEQLLEQNELFKSQSNEYKKKLLESQTSHKNEIDEYDTKWLELQKSHKNEIAEYEIKMKSEHDGNQSDVDEIKKLNARLTAQNKQIEQQNKKLKQLYDEKIKTDEIYSELKFDFDAQTNKINKLKENNARSLKQNQTSNMNQKHQILMDQHKALQTEFDELEKKYEEQQMKLLSQSRYEEWSEMDVVNWIISSNQEKYSKYREILTKNILNEGIDGSCLSHLNKDDLHRIGIINFKDKRDIFIQIKALTQI